MTFLAGQSLFTVQCVKYLKCAMIFNEWNLGWIFQFAKECMYCIFAGTSSLVKSQFISSSIRFVGVPMWPMINFHFWLVIDWLSANLPFFFFKIPVGSFWTVIHKNVKEEVSFSKFSCMFLNPNNFFQFEFELF